MHCVSFSVFLFGYAKVPNQRNRQLIGRAIREFRQRANLTQEELAEKASYHPVYIGELERGEQTASVEALSKIARALDVRIRDLVADI